jgi:GT2 family glycosyltransferase
VYKEKTDLKLEVIVVDNNSADDSLEKVKQDFPQVTIIANKFNAGFSGGNNQGMSVAKGKYIFLLNPDTEIVENALTQLHQFMEAHPEVAIAGPMLLNSDGSLQVSAWKEHLPLDMIMETFFLHKIFNRLDYSADDLGKTRPVQTLSGAALFFKKELITVIGMMDEHLFWMEDVDLCRRASRCGTIMYLHTAQVMHHSGQSQKKNYNVAISNQLLSKLKYYRRNSSFAGFVLASVFCFLFIISRLTAFGILSPFSVLYKLKAKAYFYTLKRYCSYLFMNDKRIT